MNRRPLSVDLGLLEALDSLSEPMADTARKITAESLHARLPVGEVARFDEQLAVGAVYGARRRRPSGRHLDAIHLAPPDRAGAPASVGWRGAFLCLRRLPAPTPTLVSLGHDRRPPRPRPQSSVRSVRRPALPVSGDTE